jgi:hypothetical protein
MNKDQSFHDVSPGPTESKPRHERHRERRMGREMEGLDMDEAKRAMDKLRDVGRNLGGQIETQMQERPFVVLGATLGFGFAAGALFGSRLGQIALALAAGYGLRNLVASEGGIPQGDRVEHFVKEGIDKITQDRAKG